MKNALGFMSDRVVAFTRFSVASVATARQTTKSLSRITVARSTWVMSSASILMCGSSTRIRMPNAAASLHRYCAMRP